MSSRNFIMSATGYRTPIYSICKRNQLKGIIEFKLWQKYSISLIPKYEYFIIVRTWNKWQKYILYVLRISMIYYLLNLDEQIKRYDFCKMDIIYVHNGRKRNDLTHGYNDDNVYYSWGISQYIFFIYYKWK